MQEYVFDVIHGPRQLDRFMHASDVFEDGKRLGKMDQIHLKYNGIADPEKLQKDLINAFEGAGQIVIFASIAAIIGESRPNVEAYIMPGVQIISSGTGWGLFKDMLEHYGYDVTTTQYMAVLTTKHKEIQPMVGNGG